MPITPILYEPAHKLTNDITGNVLIIDDMEPNLPLIKPSVYNLSATSNPYISDVIKRDDDNRESAQFVCSYDDNRVARDMIYRSNAQESKPENDVINSLIALLQKLSDGDSDMHSTNLSIMICIGYHYSDQDFQHLIYTYNEYAETNNITPFTLSQVFANVLKVNRMAAVYQRINDILMCQLSPIQIVDHAGMESIARQIIRNVL